MIRACWSQHGNITAVTLWQVAEVAEDNADLQNEAATKVQAAFRGHQARQHMAELLQQPAAA